MSEEKAVGFDYASLVTEALRGVVRDVLRKVVDDGLVGEQHFYVSFRTASPGVELPPYLRAQFPKEMTIVLQNQFWGLAVQEAEFSVQLRFGGKLERLTVPFAALVAFADPSVPFGLRFEGSEADPAPTTAPLPPGDHDAKVVTFQPGRRKRGPAPTDS